MRADLRKSLEAALSMDGVASSDFDLNPDVVMPKGRKLRPAGVLVPITLHAGTPHVILTKRASHLKHHPGQISFPGGKQDESDADVIAAALREADEEIGLPRNLVDVVGTMPSHETVTSFQVTPVLGIIRDTFDIVPEPGEVEEVFSVPLSHVTDPRQFQVQGRRWQGQRRHYFTVPFGPYYIWGATARILRGLAERMDRV